MHVEDHLEGADLNRRTIEEFARRNDGGVDPSAVERAEVLDDGAAALNAQVGMATRDGAVVEEDLAVWVATDSDLGDVEDEALAGGRTAHNGELGQA